MTAPTVYRSTDTGAPSLTGAAGSLVALLDAILVNGYNSNSPAGAGWAIAFTATNKRAYRNSATDGTGFYLNVDDTGTGNTVKEAFVVGFETMSAISVGTGQFPTSGQINLTGSAPAGALVCRKSITADGTARAWTAIADDTVIYLFVETGDQVNPTGAMPFVFGDIFSYKSSDVYRCIIIARNATNTGVSTNEVFGTLMASSTAFMSIAMQGHYMPRSWTGVGGSVAVAKHIDYGKMGGFGIAGGITGAGVSTSGVYWNNTNGVGVSIGFNNGSSAFPYPNGPDGGLYLSPIWIHHNGSVRGYLKGLWAPCHDRPLNHNDTFSGTGNMAGKSFVVQAIPGINAGLAIAGQVHIETSNTWS